MEERKIELTLEEYEEFIELKTRIKILDFFIKKERYLCVTDILNILGIEHPTKEEEE